MKTYTIVSFIPLPDVLPGQPTVVLASSRWDGLAASGRVSILSVDDQPDPVQIVVASAPLDGDEDDATIITLPPAFDWDDEMPADGTIRDVLAWVESADDFQERRHRAFEALTYEYDNKNRTSLVDALTAIAGDDD